MEQPLISVIVPVYKVEQYLEKCVTSILTQTYRNLEIILVDDGSPDSCPEMCDAIAHRDARVRVIHKKNGGISAARNTGLDAAQGEYITFVDSDDSLTPTACESMLARLTATGASICVGGFLWEDQDGILTEDHFSTTLQDDILPQAEAVRRITEITPSCFFTVWGKLYRREIFQKLRFAEDRIHEDVFIMHQVYCASPEIATSSVPVYHYFQRSDSITQSKYHSKRLEDSAQAYWERYLFLKARGYDAYAVHALRLCCDTIMHALRNLPIRGNEDLYRRHMGRVLRTYRNLRVVKMLLLAAKNKLTM